MYVCQVLVKQDNTGVQANNSFAGINTVPEGLCGNEANILWNAKLYIEWPCGIH